MTLTHNKINTDALLTEEQAAQYLGISPRSLSVWRCTKRYNLPYSKIGRCVRYKKSDLDAWIEKRTHNSSDLEDAD